MERAWIVAHEDARATVSGVPFEYLRGDVHRADLRNGSDVLRAEPRRIDHPLRAHVKGENLPLILARREREREVVPILGVRERRVRSRHPTLAPNERPIRATARQDAIAPRPPLRIILGGGGIEAEETTSRRIAPARLDIAVGVERVLDLVTRNAYPIPPLDARALGAALLVCRDESKADPVRERERAAPLAPPIPSARVEVPHRLLDHDGAIVGRGSHPDLATHPRQLQRADRGPLNHCRRFASAHCAIHEDAIRARVEEQLLCGLGAIPDHRRERRSDEPHRARRGVKESAEAVLSEHAKPRLPAQELASGLLVATDDAEHDPHVDESGLALQRGRDVGARGAESCRALTEHEHPEGNRHGARDTERPLQCSRPSAWARRLSTLALLSLRWRAS